MLIRSLASSEVSSNQAPKKVVVLGSTGSVGTSCLDVLRQFSDRFEVVAIAGGANAKLISEQAHEFRPKFVALEDASVLGALELDSSVSVVSGPESAVRLLHEVECDMVVTAINGFAGVASTLQAIRAGCRVVMANKESLVCAGQLVSELMDENPAAELLPVDSEHSALLQCLLGDSVQSVDKLVLTASGGPFRGYTEDQLQNVSVAQALAHPTWNMGPNITIDSALLLNKGLELIEAFWLFGLPEDRIEVVVHPQSIVHSMVKFRDGNCLAQLSVPDMKGPIAFALNFPGVRSGLVVPELDITKLSQLDFYDLDDSVFPAVELARHCVRSGGNSGLVLNAAKETGVSQFLSEACKITDVVKAVQWALDQDWSDFGSSFEDIHGLDGEVRRRVSEQFFS